MGRICSWCGAYLTAVNGSMGPISHALCSGCSKELREGLSAKGLRLPKYDDQGGRSGG